MRGVNALFIYQDRQKEKESKRNEFLFILILFIPALCVGVFFYATTQPWRWLYYLLHDSNNKNASCAKQNNDRLVVIEFLCTLSLLCIIIDL